MVILASDGLRVALRPPFQKSARFVQPFSHESHDTSVKERQKCHSVCCACLQCITPYDSPRVIS